MNNLQIPKTIVKHIPKDSVIVWLAHLPDFFLHLHSLRACLDKTEKEKVDRFHFEIHRQRHTVSQALLRILLGNYLDIKPEQIHFSKAQFGKPHIENSDIEFNISHSKDYALYAFSRSTAVGIDLEYWRERKYLDGIIDSNFSELEKEIYHSLDDSLKIASFYQGWTCNEAYIKALGMGLSFPLRDFSVEMDPRKPVKLLHVKPGSPGTVHWFLHRIMTVDEYSAALAVEKASPDIQTFLLDPSLISQIHEQGL